VHILAIGISRYASPILSLRYANADATIFSKTFSESLHRLGEFDHIRVHALLDSDATKRNILLSLRRMSGGQRALVNSPLIQVLHEIEVPGPDDVVVVYYAGHAGLVDGEFRLLPYDSHLEFEHGRLSIDQIKATSISENELSLSLERIDGSRFIVVVDACQSGQLLVSGDQRLGPINTKGFAQLAFEKGMSMIVATTPEQMAVETPALQHGLLTYALISDLSDTESLGQVDERLLTLGQWFDDAAQRVPELYRQIGGVAPLNSTAKPAEGKESQQPLVFLGREDNGQFVVYRTGRNANPN